MARFKYLPDEHMKAIGNVAVRSSQMEHHIEHLAAEAMVGMEHTAEYALKNLGADRVLGLMKAAMLDAAPEHPANIENLASEIARLRGERNDLMHWTWGRVAGDEGSAVHVSIRPFREQRVKTKTVPEIDAIADEMSKCSSAMIWWREFLFQKRHPSSPGIPGMPTHPPSFPEPSDADQ